MGSIGREEHTMMLLRRFARTLCRPFPARQRQVLERLVDRILYRLSGPVRFFSIETTAICNRSCSYCPRCTHARPFAPGQSLLADELFHKAVDELAYLGFRGYFAPHLFGEPLLDKRMPEFVRYAHAKLPKAIIQIYSNGDFLTPELYRELVAAGVKDFRITNHSGERQEAVEEIIAQRSVSGGDGVKFKYGPLKKVYTRTGLISQGAALPKNECRLLMPEFTIDYRGTVVLCCHDFLSKVQFGDIARERLLDIWLKPRFRKLRREVRKGIFELDACKKCVGVA